MRSYHLYRRIGSLRSLERAIAAAHPEVVIPCDDGVVWQLHQLYQEQPGLRSLITRSLGSAAHFEVVISRERLQQVAQRLNIRVPRTMRVRTPDELGGWFQGTRPMAVLKQDGTWGGNGVRVVRSMTEATDELTRMLQPISWTVAWKRAVVNRDPIALWSCGTRKAPVVTAQEFIRGRPANVMMACWNGKVLGTVTVEVLLSQGATGAAIVVRLIDHPEIAQTACLLAQDLELSGFHGLDFILDAESRSAYLIELNPRCTQLGHLPMAGIGDLAGLFCQKLGIASPGPAAQPQPMALSTGETVAFFPKAVLGDPKSSYLCARYHDAPQQEPALMEELLRQGWPDRQWQARLYHWFRPTKQEEPRAFDEMRPRADVTRIEARDTRV